MNVKPKVRPLTANLYNFDLPVNNVGLNDLVVEQALQSKADLAREVVATKIANPVVSAVDIAAQAPVSEDESFYIDAEIGKALEKLKATRAKLVGTRVAVNEAINNTTNGSKQLNFKFDVSKKPRIKRALKKLFGEKLDTITYSMYIELLEAKVLLESREVKDYSEGKLKDKKEKEQ